MGNRPTRRELPIDVHLPEIVRLLQTSQRLVLEAEAGAGKTTRVPPALLDGLEGESGTVVVLEPRRLAARAACEIVAAERGSAIGDEVGYAVRLDRRGGPNTRLWFVTEGTFTRRLARDPFLEDVRILVLDEFHERHVASDFALAAALELQATVRPDLQIILMSATLPAARIEEQLAPCARLSVAGRVHPVTTEYAAPRPRERLAASVARAVSGAIARDRDGDVLVFLPGGREIRDCTTAVQALPEAAHVDVLPLHGDLPLDEQRRAISPGPRRRIILATNVAETSLTIPAVTTVIDSGFVRSARFDGSRALDILETRLASQASGTQRQGRAGRVRPGHCIRLWPESHNNSRLEADPPEIHRVDLAPLALEISAWGLAPAETLRWIDPPRAASLAAAQTLVERLGAVEPGGGLTEVGKRMLEVPLAPRLARVWVECERLDLAWDGATLIALASEREILRGLRAPGADRMLPTALPPARSDLVARALLLERTLESRGPKRGSPDLDAGAVRDVMRTTERLRRIAGVRRPSSKASTGLEQAALLRALLTGFPDRVVRLHTSTSRRGRMVGGTGVLLADTSILEGEELFIAIEISRNTSNRFGDTQVRVASAIEPNWLAEGSIPITTEEVVRFDRERERVSVSGERRYLDLVLHERALRPELHQEAVSACLLDAVRSDDRLRASVLEPLTPLTQRLRFLRQHLPELGLESIDEIVDRTLQSIAFEASSIEALQRLAQRSRFLAELGHHTRQALETHAPESIAIPSGRQVTIDYSTEGPPAVAARIQELFGAPQTPRIARGRVPLVFELLAPNGRPTQRTDDLAGFWAKTYPAVRKELRGRYPKHDWPDDPLTAVPSRKISRRKPTR